MPTVGRPLASTMQTPRRAASCNAAFVRGVMTFSVLVKVPSRSSAKTLYCMVIPPECRFVYIVL